VPPAGKVRVRSKVPFSLRAITRLEQEILRVRRVGNGLMRIIAYRSQLFAATSAFTDPGGCTGKPKYTGCQVLRKSSSKADWKVDVPFRRRYVRTDCLEVMRFTEDGEGHRL